MQPANTIILVDVLPEAAAELRAVAARHGVAVQMLHIVDALNPGIPVSVQPTRPDQPMPATDGRTDEDRPFTLLEPIYDCRTNSITFQSTRAGAEYMAPGITGWTLKAGPHPVDAGPVQDGKPLTLFARFDGVEVSYTFDFRAHCNGK